MLWHVLVFKNINYGVVGFIHPAIPAIAVNVVTYLIITYMRR